MSAWLVIEKITARLQAETRARPADSPSRPSTMLKALVTPMIHRIDSGTANAPR